MELLTQANAILGFDQCSLAKYLLIVAEEDDKWSTINCSLAAENMMIYAHSIGIGSCFIGMARFVNENQELVEKLKVPQGCVIQATLVFGYADEKPEMPPKYRIEHMMFFDKWWGRLETPKNFFGWWSPYNKRIVDETKKLVKKTAKKIHKKVKEKLKKR